MEAISHAGTAIGILAVDGIVLLAERKMVSALLESDQISQEKIYAIDQYLSTHPFFYIVHYDYF
jgi:20S proteasome subunit alpha 3